MFGTMFGDQTLVIASSETPIATRELEPHANTERDAASFKLDFAAGLFESVIPGTASGGRETDVSLGDCTCAKEMREVGHQDGIYTRLRITWSAVWHNLIT